MSIFANKTTGKIEELKNILHFLNCIDNINFGGCGVSALAIYRWLKKNNQLTKTTKFIYFHNGESSYNNNKEYLENNEGTPDSCSHAVLYHKGKYIDSEGMFDNKIKKEYDHVLEIHSEDFVVESVNNITSWNNDFNRKKSIPIIMKHLDIDLSDIICSYYC